MKNIFRKMTVLSVCLVLLSANIFPVRAYNIGDVIGKTVYSDIIASINDYNIASFNFNGYTAVVAEDLRNYGFDVRWIPEERSLYITRGRTNNVASTYIAPAISPNDVGKTAGSVLYTDIKTYVNGNEVSSFNIGGNTIIYFNDLAAFGSISYNDSIRRLDLDINDGLNYKISAPYKYSYYTPSGLYFKMNSVNGLQIRWIATSNANKTINYYTTKYYMFNPVGDPAYDSYGKNYFTIRTVGPINNGGIILDITDKYQGEVYDVPVSTVLLYSIFLEYSDGTSETVYYGHIGTEESGKQIL